MFNYHLEPKYFTSLIKINHSLALSSKCCFSCVVFLKYTLLTDSESGHSGKEDTNSKPKPSRGKIYARLLVSNTVLAALRLTICALSIHNTFFVNVLKFLGKESFAPI